MATNVGKCLGRAPGDAGLGEGGIDIGERGGGQVVHVLGQQLRLHPISRQRGHPCPAEDVGGEPDGAPHDGEGRRGGVKEPGIV